MNLEVSWLKREKMFNDFVTKNFMNLFVVMPGNPDTRKNGILYGYSKDTPG